MTAKNRHAQCSFVRNKLFANVQGRNKGAQGGTILRAPNHCGKAPDYCGGRRKVPKMSQVLSSIEYTYFRKSLGSNMEAPNLLLALGPI